MYEFQNSQLILPNKEEIDIINKTTVQCMRGKQVDSKNNNMIVQWNIIGMYNNPIQILGLKSFPQSQSHARTPIPQRWRKPHSMINIVIWNIVALSMHRIFGRSMRCKAKGQMPPILASKSQVQEIKLGYLHKFTKNYNTPVHCN